MIYEFCFSQSEKTKWLVRLPRRKISKESHHPIAQRTKHNVALLWKKPPKPFVVTDQETTPTMACTVALRGSSKRSARSWNQQIKPSERFDVKEQTGFAHQMIVFPKFCDCWFMHSWWGTKQILFNNSTPSIMPSFSKGGVFALSSDLFPVNSHLMQ